MMTEPVAADALVIGFGNECRGDDGIGPSVARRIAAFGLPNVQVLTVHQLTPELAETISLVERVYFVDACRAAQATPVLVLPISGDDAESLGTHRMDPRALLMLSRILYGRVPRAWFVTVEGQQFEPGEALSSSADRLAEEAVQQIAALLR